MRPHSTPVVGFVAAALVERGEVAGTQVGGGGAAHTVLDGFALLPARWSRWRRNRACADRSRLRDQWPAGWRWPSMCCLLVDSHRRRAGGGRTGDHGLPTPCRRPAATTLRVLAESRPPVGWGWASGLPFAFHHVPPLSNVKPTRVLRGVNPPAPGSSQPSGGGFGGSSAVHALCQLQPGRRRLACWARDKPTAEPSTRTMSIDATSSVAACARRPGFVRGRRRCAADRELDEAITDLVTPHSAAGARHHRGERSGEQRTRRRAR